MDTYLSKPWQLVYRYSFLRFLSRMTDRLFRLIVGNKVPRTVSIDREANIARAFETYGTAVLRAAYAYLHNMNDAEDILQDTFLKLFHTAPAFESAAHEKAWLLRVAINLSKNKLNSAWVKNTQEIEENYPYAGLDDDLAFVWDAVRTLPPKYREPIHLFYHEGYSTAEISELLHTKEATVRSLLHRGRTLLKNILQEAYDFDD